MIPFPFPLFRNLDSPIHHLKISFLIFMGGIESFFSIYNFVIQTSKTLPHFCPKLDRNNSLIGRMYSAGARIRN